MYDYYSNPAYEAALQYLGPRQIPGWIDPISYNASFNASPLRRKGITVGQRSRPPLELDPMGPIGSYRRIGEDVRRSTAVPMDQYGRRWSSTSPDWAQVNGEWINLSNLQKAGYGSQYELSPQVSLPGIGGRRVDVSIDPNLQQLSAGTPPQSQDEFEASNWAQWNESLRRMSDSKTGPKPQATSPTINPPSNAPTPIPTQTPMPGKSAKSLKRPKKIGSQRGKK